MFFPVVGIFFLCFAYGRTQECVSTAIWEQGRLACTLDMKADDPCFWHCVNRKLGNLDEFGKLTEVSLREGRQKWAGNPMLLMKFEEVHSTCLALLEDTMEDCDAIDFFHRCVWRNPELLQVAASAICEEDLMKLLQEV